MMTIAKTPDLNDMYLAYRGDPSFEVEFGNSLMLFCTKAAHKKLKGKFHKYPEVVGDSVMRVLAKMHQFQGKSKFTTWVTIIVSNICTDAVHKRMKRNEYPLFENYDHRPESYSKEERLTLKELRSRLSPERQQLIDLKIYGLEDREIAELMGKDYRWVTNNYVRAVAEMKKNSLKK